MSSHEISLADANMAEVARLHSKLIGLRQELEQKDQAILAERRARDLALADNAALLAVVRLANTRMTWQQIQEHEALLKSDHPGAQLLAELDAARAYLDYVNNYTNMSFMYEDQQALWDAAWNARTAAMKANGEQK